MDRSLLFEYPPRMRINQKDMNNNENDNKNNNNNNNNNKGKSFGGQNGDEEL